MTDVSETMDALRQIEVADVERHRPPPEQPPRTEAEALARELARAQSRWVDAPAGWLR